MAWTLLKLRDLRPGIDSQVLHKWDEIVQLLLSLFSAAADDDYTDDHSADGADDVEEKEKFGNHDDVIMMM